MTKFQYILFAILLVNITVLLVRKKAPSESPTLFSSSPMTSGMAISVALDKPSFERRISIVWRRRECG